LGEVEEEVEVATILVEEVATDEVAKAVLVGAAMVEVAEVTAEEARATIVKERVYVNQDGIKRGSNHLKRIFTTLLLLWLTGVKLK
jgi:hypothetical protein